MSQRDAEQQQPMHGRTGMGAERVDPELSHIAGTTAFDHDIQVSIGEPGGGSYALVDEKELTLDPQHLKSPEEARFIAAHEGGHIAHTATYTMLGKNKEQCKEYAKMLGFAALRNLIEDGALNDFNARAFPKLISDTLASYARVNPEEPLGYISHPEVTKVAMLLGRPPLFASALAGLLSDWSELRHERGFSPLTEEEERSPRRGVKTESPILKRFFDAVVPLARKVINIVPEASSSSTGGERYTASATRFEWIEKVLYPELAKVVEQDLNDLAEALAAERNQQGDGNSEGQGKSGGSLTNPSQSNNPQGKQPQSEEAPEESELNSEPNSEDKREAKRQLAAIDDAFRELLESLIDKEGGEVPKSTTEVQEENSIERAKERENQESREQAILSRTLRDNLYNNLSEYQKDFATVSPWIDDAYGRLSDIFEPELHFRWRKDQPSGPKLNNNRAMEFELTGQGYDKLWERRIEPTRPDLDVVILLDRSDSMRNSGKHVAAKLALIFANELFNRFSVPIASVGFGNRPAKILDFKDDITEEENQGKISQSATPLVEGTADARALTYVRDLLKIRTATNKVIIMLSDAGSNDAEDLKLVVNELHSAGIPVIHFGIGLGTKDNHGAYKRSFGNLSLNTKDQNSFLKVFCREMENLAIEFLKE